MNRPAVFTIRICGNADAHEYEIRKLMVEHPWVRAPADGNAKSYF
jgi:hypothetical protein